MIGYVCKYTPVEVFEAFGEEIVRIEPSYDNFNNADAFMHPNMCSYSKAVLEEAISEKYEGIILVTCCDSIKRLYDVLKEKCPDKFIYLLDLQRKNAPTSIKLYKEEISKLIKSFGNFKDRELDIDNLKAIINKDIVLNSPKETDINIGIMGARCSKPTIKLIKESGANILFNLTCTALERNIKSSGKDILLDYSTALISQFPCMRMEEASKRKQYLEEYKDKLSGIIYHTVKFCDNYSYEYAGLKNQLDIPILKVETDYSKQCEGQIKTRVEAFIEALKNQKTVHQNIQSRNNGKQYVLGIDSGSTSTNAVILDENYNILSFSVVRTGAKSIESAQKAFKDALLKAKISSNELSMIVSTGYGRVSIPFAHKNITEISWHGRGSHFLNNNIRTIIDIGGQDSKVIRLNEKGEVTDFAMNDKCAAGTGRFLEMMARKLEIEVKDMGRESLKSKENISITNMCTVFAESEVISLIAQNKEKCDIIHALNNSIAGKVSSLLGRVGKQGGYMMTGGVAKNIGVVKEIEEVLGEKLFISDEPEIVGALGAAILGMEEINGKC